MNKIIVTTKEELREIIKDALPDGEKISPEERYVTTEDLCKIMKVSPQTISDYRSYGMWGNFGDNLWEWSECLKWRRDEWPKVTGGNKRRPKK